MITRTDILALEFIKKSPYTGSYKKMRYRLEMIKEKEMKVVEGEEKEVDVAKLLTTAYPGPFCFAKAPKEHFISAIFPFSEEGILQAIDYLNDNYEAVALNYGSLLANEEE